MKPRQPKRNTILLIVLILLSGIYCAWLSLNLPFTGSRKVDGILGVMFGLYTAAQPAANALDLLFYARGDLRRGLSRQAYALWWGLNGLAPTAGWFAIVYGLIRYTAR